MNKIFLIIKREYLTRVRKKSFLIMTFIGPILMAGLLIIPMWLEKISKEEPKTIAVIDETKFFNSSVLNPNVNIKTDTISIVFKGSMDVLPYGNNFSEDSVKNIMSYLRKFINEFTGDGQFIIPEKAIKIIDRLEKSVLSAGKSGLPEDSLRKVVASDYDLALNQIKIDCINEKFFTRVLPDNEYITFIFLADANIEELKKEVRSGEGTFDGILLIPKEFYDDKSGVQMFAHKELPTGVTSYIKYTLEKELERVTLVSQNIDINMVNAAKCNIAIPVVLLNEEGEEGSQAGLKQVLGWLAGFLIYIFIFMYGVQVMRGVIEEKTSRIVEIIVSSVRPFQLMMGKIVGIAFVGLTQFFMWVVLTFILINGLQNYLSEPAKITTAPQKTQIEQGLTQSGTETQQQQPQAEVSNADLLSVIDAVSNILFGQVIFAFVFYFLFGYLLYAALFAAVGSAVDAETDTQQFMLPITIPIILALISVPVIIQNPEGEVAIWLSMIPFTSPIAMMARIPYGIPWIQVYASMVILVATFIFVTWFSAKIYRTGILMYGKKITYKELWKWLKYKG
ncbi:MAG: hypothetical protein A2W91_03685 [Bacteroidetes bacterium GWF2_38_335]|nr:MAG: hypothetical protein A2W91_03685 [Bacteroidetes bacterium GWF2_38_335]OFY77415.1 MAG: hypothetical protein A2281_01075 [Bacteroidetes bacterium RIFOXYA12_FULL_38_20]HBS87297.1 ABC transporter permease [Bacteroidales bacterium]